MNSLYGTAARLACVLLISLSTGCVTTEYAGEGPLRLSPEVTQFYKKYKQKSRPEVFTVSVDGQCATSKYCPAGPHDCRQEFIDHGPVSSCEYRCGVPCGMLDVRGVTVWKGPVTDAEGNLLNP